jgi:phage terminase small subunit
MTARSTHPDSVALSAKREDLTPKPQKRRGERGTNPHATISEARSRGTDTSNLSAEEMALVISPDKLLTEKQKLFVKFWAEGDSIPGASRRAGYADGAQMAYRMVKMPNILKLRNEYAAKYEEEAQMDRKQVMDGFKEAIEMARLMAEPANMIAGWREIGKMCGYYAPVETRVKVDVSGNLVLDKMNSLTDAELLKIISQGAAYASPQLLTDETDGGEAD